jgi:hypothetical protein
VSRPFNYYSGIQIDGNGFNQIAYRPLETVTNNGIVSSRDIVVLDMTTFPRTVSIYTNFLINEYKQIIMFVLFSIFLNYCFLIKYHF